MSSSLAPQLKTRFFDAGGDPLAGGLLWSYQSGTVIPLQTFTDVTGLTPNPNPVVLDADGYCDLWLGDTAYKFILQDSLGVQQFVVDPVQSLASQIASAISTAGALAVNNNLSDLASVPMALRNLGIAPFQYQIAHAITNNQAATNLAGETFDGTLVTTIEYEYEIIQGTTIMSRGDFAVQYLNGTWVYVEGMTGGTGHGITFSLSQATTIGQLKAAEGGQGNGTIKLKRHFFFV